MLEEEAESAPIVELKLTISVPSSKPIVIQVLPDTSVAEIRNHVQATSNNSCFTLRRSGVILEDASIISEIDGFTAEPTLELVYAMYTESEIKTHVLRLSSTLTAFDDASMSGIKTSSSAFESISTNEEKLDNAVNGIEVDMCRAYPSVVDKKIACLASLSLSAFSPVPISRRTQGDLVYLCAVTLEGDMLEIVGTSTGFYVSNSESARFDPSRRTNDCATHTLPGCLSLASPIFAAKLEEMQHAIRNSHPFEMIASTFPLNPWCVSPNAHTSDSLRTIDQLFKTADTISTATRDWNEDQQTLRELPTSTTSEALQRDQALCRHAHDFAAFAKETAVGIIDGTIAAMNMSDCPTMQMYIHGILFFSTGYDPKSHVMQLGGAAAAHVAAGKDVDGISAIVRSGVDVCTLGTCVVDYKGTRMVVQTIIPGILRRVSLDTPVKYGLVDDEISENETYACDPEFHAVFAEMGEKMAMKEHSVVDSVDVKAVSNGDLEKKDMTLYTSLESKGILGNDKRRYLLDCYRTTPVDVLFLESVRGDEAVPYPHEVCLIRHEAINIYEDYKIRVADRIAKEGALEGAVEKEVTEPNGEDKAEAKEEEAVVELAKRIKYNVDCFTPAYKAMYPDRKETQDEIDILALSKFISTVGIESLIIEIVNYPALIPMDGTMLTRSMHFRGINMRYLGKVFGVLDAIQADTIVIFKEVIKTEMVTRGCKHLLRRILNGLSAPLVPKAIAHFFNCLFSSDSATLSVGQDMRDMVDESQLAFLTMTHESLHADLQKIISERFRLKLENIAGFVASNGYPITKSICQKVGIQLLARAYNFAKPEFTSSDVLNLFAITKAVEQKSSFADSAMESARVYFTQEDKQIGVDVMIESMSIYEQTLGPIHPSTAKAYGQLAMMYFQLDNFALALQYQRQALLSTERTLGADDSETLTQYIALGYFEFMNGEQELGIRLLKYAEYMLGLMCGTAIHQDRASCDTYLGNMHEKMGENTTAIQYHGRALATNELIYGKDHPATLSSLDSIGRNCQLAGDFRGALNAQRSVYSFYLKKLGKDDKKVVDMEVSLGVLTGLAVKSAKELRRKLKAEVDK